MADENKFLHLGNSNDKILYEKFKGKLEKKDIATNNKLLQIFNFFDKDGNGIIETANSKGVNEMQSLWNAVRTSATKNSNSIFEDAEAQELLENSVDSTGKSLADNQVTASDLFAFLKALITPQTKLANGVKLEDLKPEDIVEYTQEEIEDISIQTVTDGVKQAREVFDAQKAQQGAVSDLVDGTKEAFDTEYASSRVNRYLMNEEFCAQALQRSQEGNLTEKEYLEAKIELVVKMLPELQSKELKSTIIKQILTFGLYKDFGNKTKAEQERIVKEMEIEYLKEALKNFTPEELTVFIKKVTSLSDDEYKEQAPKVVENLINQIIQKKEIDNKPVLSDSIQIKIVNPPRQGSIEDIVSHQDAYRVMEFEETFSKERGVEYNPEAIMNYSTKEAQLQFLVGMHNRNEAVKNILHDATVAVDGNNKYGAPQHDAIETCNQNLANQIERAFRSLYSKNAAEAQRVIDEIMGQNSGIKVVADEQGNFIKLEFYGFKRNSLNLDLLGSTKPEGTTQETEVGFENNKFRMPVNAYSLVHLSKGLQQKLEDNYQTALNGKTLDEYSAEVKSAYQMAYGAKNAQDMANAFAQSQQEGVQNTKAVVQGLGMVAMVAGQLIPVGGQVATALVMGGMATSTLGSVGVSAVENYTKAGGPTEEDKKAMLQELGTSLALVGTGMGIGKGSEAIFRTLVMKNCPKLIAFAAEVGVDATASLLADYAITGQIDLSGEGIAQLQNILVGIIGAKGARNYLNTHAGDITTRPITEVKRQGTRIQQNNNEVINLRIESTQNFLKDGLTPEQAQERVKILMELCEKYKNVSPDLIYGLTKNNSIRIQIIDSQVRYNGFEKILEYTSQYPKYQKELLTLLQNDKFYCRPEPEGFDYDNNNIYQYLENLNNPNFDKIVEITGFKEALTGLQNIYPNNQFGVDKYNKLNALVHGSEPSEFQAIKEQFKQLTGCNLHIDNNIPPAEAKIYMEQVAKVFEIIKKSGRKPPEDIFLTEWVTKGAGGIFSGSGENKCYMISVKPEGNNQTFFQHAVLHESIHMLDRNTLNKTIDSGFRFMAVGTDFKIEDGEYMAVRDNAKIEQMCNYATKYVSEYAGKSVDGKGAYIHELCAELGTLLMEKKIIVKEIYDKKGNIIDFDLKVKEPYTNIDGKSISFTEIEKAELKELIKYYFSAGGQNFSNY